MVKMTEVKTKAKKIGVVLPAYNEGRVIKRVLAEIPRKLSINGQDYALQPIVVNDGSTDNTVAEVQKDPNVILINHILQSGAGAATRTGLHFASSLGCDYALTMDSDGQHSVKDLIKLVEAIIKGNDDFIIGSRLKETSGNMPLSKRVGNFGLGMITFLLLGVYASDTQSGFKALNKKALAQIDFHSNGYAFCSEMIWKAHQQGLKVSEIAVEAIYTDYSKSRGQKNLTGAIEITKQLIKRRFLSIINE